MPRVKSTLLRKKVDFVSKKEAIDTTTPSGKFMLTVFGAAVEAMRRLDMKPSTFYRKAKQL